jgi:hypothetical protein
MKWVEHASYMGEEKYGILKGQRFVENLGVDVRITLKWFLKKFKDVVLFYVSRLARVGRPFQT